MREAWPSLQTPAVVFEQHTTLCLKISRVESTIVVASHLCPPNTKPLSMPLAAASRCLPTPPMTCTYGDAPAWGWLAPGECQPALASRRRMGED